VAGEKYDRIIDYQLGEVPPRLDGSDERDGPDLYDDEFADQPFPDLPTDHEDIPF
jgi:hypothetical protein